MHGEWLGQKRIGEKQTEVEEKGYTYVVLLRVDMVARPVDAFRRHLGDDISP